jgi:hydrogenase/urease accessory protein HupE
MDTLLLLIATVLALLGARAYGQWANGDSEALLYTLGYSIASILLVTSAVT